MHHRCLQSTVYSLPRKSEDGSRKTAEQIGQSLIEVIVACSVGILVVAALTFATIFSLRNANFAKNSAQATKLAQEGIERVRSGRDRNLAIGGDLSPVTFWDGSSNTACTGYPAIKDDSIWCYQIKKINGCENTTSGQKCYFTVNSAGALTYINSWPSFPTLSYESIPSSADPRFKRVVILSDDSTSYTIQKTVTVIVTWTDFSGPHESKLTTILRKL